MVDISRETSNVQLPPELSAEIWQNAQESSVIMQLGQQVSLPGAGKTIQIITGDPSADWVDETAEKPVSRATLGVKSMTPYKLAVIQPFSEEFRRDIPGLYNELARRMPAVLGKKFDETVLGTTAPGSNFDTLGAATAVGIKPGTGKNSTYAGLIDADQSIANGGGLLNGWALSPQARGLLLGQTDGDGRPFFINNVQTDGAVPALLGAPVHQSKAVYKAGSPNVLGVAGDWTSAHWGTVQGIKIAFSDTATLTDGSTEIAVEGGAGGETVSVPNLLNLWQRNMFAVRVEIEVGFVARDVDHFVRLTDTVLTGH